MPKAQQEGHLAGMRCVRRAARDPLACRLQPSVIIDRLPQPSDRIYVFTGPTLSADDASAELEALYLPPAAQGDVYRVALDRPRAIAIIDGYFETVPSVWHKEILWAMSRGIHVYGSASMGALRAAELHDFGMIGVGKIFEHYRDGILSDDDEVAVTVGGEETGFRQLSEAMVNIRATLAAAERAHVIRPRSRRRLEEAAKSFHYPNRTYPALLAAGRQLRVAHGELVRLRDWLPTGRVDQKQRDAYAMLRRIRADRRGRLRARARVAFVFEHTGYWDAVTQTIYRGPVRATGTRRRLEDGRRRGGLTS